MLSKRPRVLLFDLESVGVNALQADLGLIAVFAWKWLGEREVHAITLADFGGLPGQKSKYIISDKALLVAASKIMQEADLLVGHFASVFDRRMFQGRLLINGLPPIPPTKLRDTKFIASSQANFGSNRLGILAENLGLGEQKMQKKRPSEWPGWWFRVMAGDKKALAAMRKYALQDVRTLEDVYLRLRPFDTAHVRIYSDRSTCKACGSAVEYRGFAYQGDLRYRRYVCKGCKRWDREHKAFKGV